ncbi:hypothetical protein [Bacillus sp. FJAT-49736]|uniref:hypothetical protein n=1 Tax=Bacillus sp. FJAT-49736 TaxID=2833582 RepID=UPI001BC9DA60|nr:hypothetical protein [Bacillus sp. FJAT-49736]MBS4171951.1 hypothetical protein [Bacillus sp. FJAT-49736]
MEKGGLILSENERIFIDSLVSDLEDVFWITDKIENEIQKLECKEKYQRILNAIKMLEQEHDTLYKLINQ